MRRPKSEVGKEMDTTQAQLQLGVIPRIYAHNDPGAHGAYLAALAAKREKDILFVGIDGLAHEGQMYVKEGILAASFEYPTGGKEAIDTALQILRGEAVPKEITLDATVYTPESFK